MKDQYAADRHPDVTNGRKTADEQLTDFIEIYDVHHNVFNDYNRNPNVSKAEFVRFYRTLNPNYDDDVLFVGMVKNVWGVREEKLDNSKMSFAGGNDPSKNSRDRYNRQNVKNQPFGVSAQDSTT